MNLEELNKFEENIRYNIALKLLNEYVCCNIYFRMEKHHKNKRELIEAGDIHGVVHVNRYIKDQISSHQACYWITAAAMEAIEPSELQPDVKKYFETSKMCLLEQPSYTSE